MPRSSAMITAAFSPMTRAVLFVFAATFSGQMERSKAENFESVALGEKREKKRSAGMNRPLGGKDGESKPENNYENVGW